MQLNREQAQCVEADGHCLVVACPGSGKTGVIARKVAALLARHPDARICAVTFTRDAAGELTERIVKLVGEAKFKQACRVGTFHSLAIRQLRNAKLLGDIASPAQQYALVMRAMSQAKFEGVKDDAIQLIEAAKTAFGEHPALQHPLYEAYAELLSRQKLVDLYDVLRSSVQLMRTGKLPPYPVPFMLVDEFQDTDPIQFAWVMEHAKAGSAITCVGDDDQSIYAWRGALGYRGMMDFKAAAGAELITLGQNYRSHAEVLQFADRVIHADTERLPKALISARGAGGSVTMHRAGTLDHEAEMVAEEIARHAEKLPYEGGVFEWTVAPKRWAVLARNRRYLDVVESILQFRRIKYVRSASESLWNRPPFLQMVTLLRSLQTGNPDGVDSALHHCLAVQFGSQAANTTLDALHRLAGDDFTQILDGVIHPEASRALVAAEMQEVASFARRCEGWRKRVANGEYRTVINVVASWLGGLEKDDRGRDLVERMGEFLAALDGSLVTRTNSLGQRDQKTGPADGVVLATMHATKGLEFDNVWIVGCNDNVIPSPKSNNLPEERRLLYVAITRAKHALHLSATTESKVTPLLSEVGVTFDGSSGS